MIRPELSNTVDALSALAAVMRRARSVSPLGDVLDDHLGTRSTHLSHLVGGSVVAESAPVGNSLYHLW